MARQDVNPLTNALLLGVGLLLVANLGLMLRSESEVEQRVELYKQDIETKNQFIQLLEKEKLQFQAEFERQTQSARQCESNLMNNFRRLSECEEALASMRAP